ncbi:MAG TPA: mechanosensitive ion channel domain-containing protein [Blastocatellia bacterium]|nr:mechanosensitive ion channel domain-containing protein [Blastocatellia bacterium]
MLLQDEPSALSFGDTLLERVVKYLNYPFVNQKEFRVSILSLLLLILIVLIATLVSRYTRRFLQKRVLPRFHIEIGLQYTLLRLVHYLIIALGVLYAMKIGFSVDLTSIAVILGFLSVGIGFGLQYVAADIASGFILLFERPIRIGDWVRLSDDMEGRVETISLRSTVIITNENLAVIVPNSKLVQNKFVNYSYGKPVVRLNVPIGVAYGSDLEKVSIALLEAARSVERVLNNPEPKVHFSGFGDSSIDLQIRVWIDKPRDHTVITSDVNFAVEAAFRKYNIEIPFPQRDLHVRTGSLGLAQDDSGFTKIEANPRQP